MGKKTIRLGTRASPLALAQADITRRHFATVFPELQVERHVIETTGDKDQTSPMHAIGGKGVFIKEIEQALLKNQIDIAVHSLKDITSNLAEGLHLISFLKAEAFGDVIVSKEPYHSLDDLPREATLATGSLRRKALLKQLRPDIKTIEIRGNVNTRLKKLDEGKFEGVLLSEAGLIRLGIKNYPICRLDHNVFYPAPGQGVIALETRKDDVFSNEIALMVNHKKQHLLSTMEIEFLKVLGLDCSAPLGAHASFSRDKVHLRAFVTDPSMTHFKKGEVKAFPTERLKEAKILGKSFLEWLSNEAIQGE